MTTDRTAREAIAIIGLGGRFPGTRSLDAFWQNVRAGVDCVQEFTDTDLEAAGVSQAARSLPSWVPRGTVLEDADLFDAAFFGYSPREAEATDPQHRVFLECAWEALEHAGYAGEAQGRVVGMYGGASMNTYVFNLASNPAILASVGGYQLMLGNDKDFLCTRVSYKLDLHGPSMTIQTACSTSLVAVQVACRALQRGECDMALAGGVSIGFPQRAGYQYQEGMILSPDGICRPFDVDAKGTRGGAGAGIVVLKRLDDAIADGDTVHAVILGAAINNDGAGKAGYTAPSVDGQVEVIAMAQALAGVTPDTVTYVEAHGTGTPLGDPIEIAALTRVFRASTNRQGYCTIGSLKANLGHLDAAAGVAGLIKTVYALKHRELPPLTHFNAANPHLALDTSPFRVARAVEAWSSTGVRRAGVSAFGIGGTNAHVVLQEAPEAERPTTHRDRHVLVLSARTSAALTAATHNLVEHLQGHPAMDIASVAHTLQAGRRAFPFRRAVVVGDVAEAVERLSRADRAPVYTGAHQGGVRTVSFLFSGQGSQHAGMGATLYRTEPVYRDVVDRCAAILAPMLGADVLPLLLDASDDALAETRLTQPLLFVTELALATLWMQWGVQPVGMLGHSIGEYVAAHLAGVMTLEDALTIVAARGRLMQSMPAGSMLGVHLSVNDLQKYLEPGVELAAHNAPTLCSVSGTTEGISALAEKLTRAGVEHRTLRTSHAFHSAMMDAMLEEFRAVMGRVTLTAPSRPYVSNVTGTWILADEATSPEYYVRHLRGVVQFAAGVKTLAADPASLLLEVGPGTVLTSLARLSLGKDGASRVLASLAHPRDRTSDDEAVLGAVARMWTMGVAFHWSALHRDEQLHRVPLPTYPFERQRYWVDAVPRDTAPQRDAGAGTPFMPARLANFEDWFQAPTWMRADLLRTRTSCEGTWMVFGQADALTESVVSAVRAHGAHVVTIVAGDALDLRDVNRYVVRPDDADDHVAAVRQVVNNGGVVAGVLHLWNARAPDSVERDRLLASDALMALGAAIVRADLSAPMRILVATQGAQSVLAEGVANPDRAMVTGLVLGLPFEQESVRVCAIDLDVLQPGDWWTQATADLLAEATAADSSIVDDTESFVARRDGVRFVRRFHHQPLDADRAALPVVQGGVYLVTGGLGGIGLTISELLATEFQARLLLVSRTPLPARGEWPALLAQGDDAAPAIAIRAILRMEAAGGEVYVASADVGDLAAMREALTQVPAAWGPIHGVIHGAGVPGVGLIGHMTDDARHAVLRPKVNGLDVLVELLGETVLDFVLLCSSINAVAGAAGASMYAAANAYLDAFAASVRQPPRWQSVMSVGWSAWRDVGMAAALNGPARKGGPQAAVLAAGIPSEQGVESILRCLASGLRHVVVTPFDIQASVEAAQKQRWGKSMRTEASHANGELTAGASDAALSRFNEDGDARGEFSEKERKLAVIWEDLLGTRLASPHENFFDLGGHSLMATRVLARIEATFGVRLPLRAIFDAPTVSRMSQLIDEEHVADVPAATAGVAQDREEFEF